VLVLVVLVILGCSVVGWRMWQAQRQREAHAIQWPTVNSVTLPPDVEAGQTISLGGTANNLTNTKTGSLYVRSCRIENRQWVVTLDWERHDADDERPTLHLGESTHLTGLGTITLLSVTLPSPAPPDDFHFPWEPPKTIDGGYDYIMLNVTLDPGVVLCTVGDNFCNESTQQPTTTPTP
jgi:hypothetical protein